MQNKEYLVVVSKLRTNSTGQWRSVVGGEVSLGEEH